jgi:hypothetical protein
MVLLIKITVIFFNPGRRMNDFGSSDGSQIAAPW